MTTPFDRPDLYDAIFDQFQIDIEFWKSAAPPGPVLDLGCGTGRVTIPLLQMGLEVEGADASEPMLARFREKAAGLGFDVKTYLCEMHTFRSPRRYATIVCAFNSFAHNFTAEMQIATLRACRKHLAPGGKLVLHMSLPPPSMWLEAEGPPVLECEVAIRGTGRKLQLWDRRTLNRVEQTQHSVNELRVLGAGGETIESFIGETDVKWITKPEMELLLRAAGFEKFEILGGFDRRPIARDSDEMLVFAYR
jgi:SAM-dependent methyltransferase